MNECPQGLEDTYNDWSELVTFLTYEIVNS